MLENLKADYELCKVAMAKHLHQKKWYRRAITLDKFLQTIVATGFIALFLLLYFKYLFSLLGGFWTAIIALLILVLILCWAIRAIRYFHEDTVSVLRSQHKTATNIFHRNADIIARLNSYEGKANEIMIRGGFTEESAKQWTSGIIEYLQHYKLDDLIDRFIAPDHKLLEVLPENLPLNPDELRNKRMDARQRLLSTFTRELRNQAINSPYGRDADSTSLINEPRNHKN